MCRSWHTYTFVVLRGPLPYPSVCVTEGTPLKFFCVCHGETLLMPSVYSTGRTTRIPVCEMLERPNPNVFVYSTWGPCFIKPTVQHWPRDPTYVTPLCGPGGTLLVSLCVWLTVGRIYLMLTCPLVPVPLRLPPHGCWLIAALPLVLLEHLPTVRLHPSGTRLCRPAWWGWANPTLS